MKPLSQQLADLSVRAKAAEERIATAQAEARERVNARRAEIEREVQGVLVRVEQSFTEAKDEAKSHIAALQSKVVTDAQNLKDRFSRARGDFEARMAQDYAEDMVYEAGLAIDYAIAAVAMAELAALDAIAAQERLRTEPVLTATPA